MRDTESGASAAKPPLASGLLSRTFTETTTSCLESDSVIHASRRIKLSTKGKRESKIAREGLPYFLWTDAACLRPEMVTGDAACAAGVAAVVGVSVGADSLVSRPLH